MKKFLSFLLGAAAFGLLFQVYGYGQVVIPPGTTLNITSNTAVPSGGGTPAFGPGSSTDNAVALWNGTGGNLLKNSTLIYNGTSLLVPSTNTVRFGATALASIGVSADTTAGDLTFTSSTTGRFVFGGTGSIISAASTDLTLGSGASGDVIINSASGRSILLKNNGTTLFMIGSTSTLTGGAGNMILIAGTGPSRTWTVQTTTSGSTATNAIVANATQDVSIATGNLTVDTIGKTLSVKSGSNAKAGTFTLSSGTATVSNTSVTANSNINFTIKTVSGTITSAPFVSATVVGTSFTVTGAATNNSTYNYIITEVN